MTLHDIQQESLSTQHPIIGTVFKADGTKVLAIRMKRGVVLQKHTAPHKAKTVSVKGKVNSNIENQSKRLAVYDSYDMPLEVPHAVEAYEDALFLLLLES